MTGQVVGAFMTSHSPGITGWPERAAAGKREVVERGFAEAARRIDDLDPDALVVVSVEHFTNFGLGNLPAFAIATDSSYLGPVTVEMARFLEVPQREHRGSVELGEHIYEFALGAGFDPSLVQGGMQFDENFSVPLRLLDPEARYPLVPIIVNGVNPPYPTLTRCYDFGVMIRAAVQAQDRLERVVVLGTGGLSHWVGLPESGQINEGFDRDFLERLATGDPARMTDYTTAEIDSAGNGAHEIRSWLIAAGAMGGPVEVLAYEAVPEWLTGTAVAAVAGAPAGSNS